MYLAELFCSALITKRGGGATGPRLSLVASHLKTKRTCDIAGRFRAAAFAATVTRLPRFGF